MWVRDSKWVADDEIVYVREQPLLRLATLTLAALISIVVFLFVLGFILSFIGYRPPTFDSNIVRNQWSKIMDHSPHTYQQCVDARGKVDAGPPPTCIVDGKTFTEENE